MTAARQEKRKHVYVFRVFRQYEFNLIVSVLVTDRGSKKLAAFGVRRTNEAKIFYTDDARLSFRVEPKNLFISSRNNQNMFRFLK